MTIDLHYLLVYTNSLCLSRRRTSQLSEQEVEKDVGRVDKGSLSADPSQRPWAGCGGNNCPAESRLFPICSAHSSARCRSAMFILTTIAEMQDCWTMTQKQPLPTPSWGATSHRTIILGWPVLTGLQPAHGSFQHFSFPAFISNFDFGIF